MPDPPSGGKAALAGGRARAVEIRLVGTGGRGGWPRPDCRCASCERARSAGRRRAPAHVLVDGVLRIGSGGPPCRASEARHAGDGAGYRLERVPGGWDVTGPDGARLLVGEWRGPPTAPPRAGDGAAEPGAPLTRPRAPTPSRHPPFPPRAHHHIRSLPPLQP